MKKIKKIIIGTHNQGKMNEISDLLPISIKKISPKDLNISSPEETGDNFEDNSKLKAKFFSEKSNLISVADDSGLEIDCLNGAPGIYSARWAGKEGDFDKAIEKVFNEILKVDSKWESKKIVARFICCLTIYWPDGKLISSKGSIEGFISNKKLGKNGFGYDPIFVPNGYKKTFGQMDSKLKYTIDHRYKAYSKISNLFS